MLSANVNNFRFHLCFYFSVLCFRGRGRWKRCHWSQVSCCVWNMQFSRNISSSTTPRCFTPSRQSTIIFYLLKFLAFISANTKAVIKHNYCVQLCVICCENVTSVPAFVFCFFLNLQEQWSSQVLPQRRGEAELRAGEEVSRPLLIRLINHCQYKHWDTDTHCDTLDSSSTEPTGTLYTWTRDSDNHLTYRSS